MCLRFTDSVIVGALLRSLFVGLLLMLMLLFVLTLSMLMWLLPHVYIRVAVTFALVLSVAVTSLLVCCYGCCCCS